MLLRLARRRSAAHCALGALALTSLTLAGESSAADYFVATDGDDGNPGTEAQPFGTIHHGLQTAQNGDVLNIRGWWTRTPTRRSSTSATRPKRPF
jgi:nicotinamide mononucleotide (NMN) deamidase PncC